MPRSFLSWGYINAFEVSCVADVVDDKPDRLSSIRDPESLRGCRIGTELENTSRYTMQQQAARLEQIGLELRECVRNVFAHRRREATMWEP